MSQLVYSIHWNPEEVGSNASEGMGLLDELGLLPYPVYRLPLEGVTQF